MREVEGWDGVAETDMTLMEERPSHHCCGQSTTAAGEKMSEVATMMSSFAVSSCSGDCSKCSW